MTVQDHRRGTGELPSEVASALRRIDARAQVAHAEVAGLGWDVVAWRVRSVGGDWTVRIPRHAEALGTLAGQQRLGARLASLGFPVPRDHRLLTDRRGRLIAGLYR